jgi:FkbM family methyltransferase
MGGVYEPHVVDACVRLLRPGDTFFDVGANLGLVSMEVAQQVPGATLIAVEPQAELARHVAVSAALNGFHRFRVYRCLIADGSELQEAELHVPAHSIHASLISRSARACSELVPALGLDALADHADLPDPDVVKVDVEGAEALVMRGGRRVIAAGPASVVFEADQNMKRFGYDRAVLFDMLGKLADYTFFYIPDDRSPPRQLTSPAEAVWNGNYIACASRHLGRLRPKSAC